MRNYLSIIVFVTLLFSCTQQPIETADIIYINGKIYTVNEANPWAEAVAVKDEKFLAVGSNQDIEKTRGNNTKVVDLDGQLVIPGLIDTHSHPGVAAYDLFNKWELPSTFDDPTWEELKNKIEEGQKVMADEPWFLGHSYTRTAWPEEKYNRWYLDEIFGNQPAFIYMEGQHESIANTKALEIAGLDKNSPDPTGGRLGRDPASGMLNGVLYEDPAAQLVEKHIPPISIEKKAEGLIRAFTLMHGYGYTGFFDAQYGGESTVAAYGKLLSTGNLPMHMKVVIDAFGYGGPDKALAPEEVTDLFDQYNIPNSMRSVKLQLDGSIEGYTAPLLEGYADKPGYNSSLMAPVELLRKLMKGYDQEGLQILTHAIADSSVRVNLDIYEELIKERGENKLRHKIDHAVVVAEKDIDRFGELGIPVCPLVVVNQDMPYTRQLMNLLGPEARRSVLPNGRLMKSGAIVSGTSDWPGSPELNPMNLVEVMVTRKGLRGSGEIVGLEEDCLTVGEAVKSFTINGAWTMGLDDKTGSIEEGKWADMAVLDQNIFEIEKSQIGTTNVIMTLFKGEKVFDAEIHVDLIQDVSPEEIWSLFNDYQCISN